MIASQAKVTGAASLPTRPPETWTNIIMENDFGRNRIENKNVPFQSKSVMHMNEFTKRKYLPVRPSVRPTIYLSA